MSSQTATKTDIHSDLRKNKSFPEKYEIPILTALAAYPGLKTTKINFKLSNSHPVPYSTMPATVSIFSPAAHREYDITILEKAEEPGWSALFRNLSLSAQIAVIAHELAHVAYFQALSIPQLVKTLLLYPLPGTKKKLERAADDAAIKHGFGKELYEHAVYIRSIPGYTRERPEIYKYYLQLDEIMERLQ